MDCSRTTKPSVGHGGKLLAVIDRIRKKVRAGDLEFTVPHFIEEMVNDDLTFADIEMAISRRRIRRRFTRDPRGTRYEIVGPATDGRQLAVTCRIKTPGNFCSSRPTLSSEAMKRRESRYDYGACHACGGRMEERRIKQHFWTKRGLIVIEDFPAGVCRRCGEKVVKADVGRLVAELVEGSRRLRKTRTMSVPVIKFVNNVA